MDIKSVTKDYVECASGGAVTAPNNGSWISAYAIHLGATTIVNGSWLQTLCFQLGITSPVNSSWVIALADYYGISQPVNGSWWYAIADNQCNPVGPPPFIWDQDTLNWEAESRLWAALPPFSGILDTYTGAAVAFSASRRLSSTYTGPLVKVVKSGSSATDIGYDAATNELDTTALAAYAGSDTVYVEKWYDQSGNGKHAEQLTGTRQPIIVTTGTIETVGGKVAIRFDGSDDYMPLVSTVQSDTYGLGTFTFNRVQGTTQVALGDEQDNIYPVYPFNNNIAYSNLGAGGNGIGPTIAGHSGITCRVFDKSGAGGSSNQLEGWINSSYNAGSGQAGPGNPALAFDAYGTRQLSQFTNNLHNEFIFWRGEKTNTFSNGVHNDLGTYYGTGTV